MNSRSDFLQLLQTAAKANAGKPPGESTFFRDAGLTRKDLWAAGFASYGAACEAAGLRANTLTPRMPDSDLLRLLATLARKLGRFPTKGAFEVTRAADPTFPSWEAFKRREKQGPENTLREILVAWCLENEEFADVAAMLEVAVATVPTRTPRGKPIVNGYVYLMRYGSGGQVFKIGLTDDVARRHSQLNMMAPQDVRVLHSIATDDPPGIERYWKDRFEAKRLEGKKELFRLAPDDVAAFKSRTYQ